MDENGKHLSGTGDYSKSNKTSLREDIILYLKVIKLSLIKFVYN
jgi:hypothetical protein